MKSETETKNEATGATRTKTAEQARVLREQIADYRFRAERCRKLGAEDQAGFLEAIVYDLEAELNA